MEKRNIYEDIVNRTGGCIYIGVVGPVRTGKSTFIKRFMETLVLPNIEDEVKRERARDELPQSGSGRMIMTAEPKFVPEEAVELNLNGETQLSVRLIDCVGYMAEGAGGQMENDQPRMVSTPWFDHEVSITEAAETGTRRVIEEHSTIGLVVTTDGTVTDLPRESYVQPEARVIGELKALGKPFIVVLNTAEPCSEAAKELCAAISAEHGVSCIPLNCQKLDESAITELLTAELGEFPLTQIEVFLPEWVEALPADNELKSRICASLMESSASVDSLKSCSTALEKLLELAPELIKSSALCELGTGCVKWRLELPRAMFYETLSESSGFEIKNDGELMSIMAELHEMKAEYDRVADALRSVRETGYGIVGPSPEELTLEEPEIVRHGGRYGVRLKASAPSIHMLRANIETEVSPAVSAERQNGDLISYLLQEFEGDTGRIWESNIFGKSLYDIAGENVAAKLERMPAEVQGRLRETLQRIVNEGSSKMICILL